MNFDENSPGLHGVQKGQLQQFAPCYPSNQKAPAATAAKSDLSSVSKQREEKVASLLIALEQMIIEKSKAAPPRESIADRVIAHKRGYRESEAIQNLCALKRQKREEDSADENNAKKGKEKAKLKVENCEMIEKIDFDEEIEIEDLSDLEEIDVIAIDI